VASVSPPFGASSIPQLPSRGVAPCMRHRSGQQVSFLGRPLTPLEAPLPSYDLWGLGCVLTELCTLRLLEDRAGGAGSLALQDSALSGAIEETAVAHKGEFRGLVAGLLHRDPEERLTARAVATEAHTIARPKASWITALARTVQAPHCLWGTPRQSPYNDAQSHRAGR